MEMYDIRIVVMKSRFSKRLQDIAKARLRIIAHYSGDLFRGEVLPPLLLETIKASTGSSLTLLWNGAQSVERLEVILLGCVDDLDTPVVLGKGFIESTDLFSLTKSGVANGLKSHFLSCHIFNGADHARIANLYFKCICSVYHDGNEIDTEWKAAKVPCNREQQAVNLNANRSSVLFHSFRFQKLCKHINWNYVQAMDVEKVRNNCEYDTLLVCMNYVCVGNISNEDEVDSRLSKALKAAQLISQFLLSSCESLRDKRKYIDGASRLFDFEEGRLDQRIGALRAREKRLIDENINLNEANKNYKRLLTTVDPILTDRFQEETLQSTVYETTRIENFEVDSILAQEKRNI